MKPLIATIVFNSNRITNECFLKSLYNVLNDDMFDLLIVSTSDQEFKLSQEYAHHRNIQIIDFKKKYQITTHALAIQKILSLNKEIYDDIIICENDVVVKSNLTNIIDKSFQFVGQDSKTLTKCHWWTKLYQQLHFGCRRYLPMLMYFNVARFKDRKIIFEKNDCNLHVNIPSLSIDINLNNTNLCDPGWYFMLWCEKNGIKCKNIEIDDYISHFWYGSENRNSNSEKTYDQRLEKFKEENLEYL